MGNYGNAPQFESGQVLSAAQHMNPLQTYVQGLADGYKGPSLPFNGMQTQADLTEYSGYIFHKYDRCSYSYELLAGGNAELRINNQTVPGSEYTGNGVHSATDVDISSLGLTVDELYTVALVGNENYRIWKFCETYSPTLPTLPAATDESTPSTAEWQAFSTYADLLDEKLSAPRACGVTAHRLNPTFMGVLNHRCRYLAYDITICSPYYEDNAVIPPPGELPEWQPGGHREINAYLSINGEIALRLRCGKDEGSPATPDGITYNGYWFRNVNGWAASCASFVGLLDLDAYPVGHIPAYGTDYELLVNWQATTISYDTGSNISLAYLYEVDETALALSGWQAFTAWTHGNYVYGNSNTPQVHTLKNNLEVLGNLLTCENYACQQKKRGEGLYGVRRWRYLYYITTLYPEDIDGDGVDELVSLPGAINYKYRGKDKSVTLNGAGASGDLLGVWQVKDLETVSGLYPGTAYSLHDVDFAFELPELPT